MPEGEIDPTAEILQFDAVGGLSDFEKSEIDYNGEDRRGTPTNNYDDDFSDFLPNF